MTFASKDDYANIDAVEGDFTDVVEIVPVQDGWMVFTDARQLEIWQAQQ